MEKQRRCEICFHSRANWPLGYFCNKAGRFVSLTGKAPRSCPVVRQEEEKRKLK